MIDSKLKYSGKSDGPVDVTRPAVNSFCRGGAPLREQKTIDAISVRGNKKTPTYTEYKRTEKDSFCLDLQTAVFDISLESLERLNQLN